MPHCNPLPLSTSRKALLLAASSAAMFASIGCGSGIAGSVVASSSAPAVAPSAVQSGPQLGYIWSDKTQTLRPVLGVAGSSQLGQSVVAPGLYTAAATSSVTNLAILQESDGTLYLMSLPSGTPTRLAASVAPGARLRFSPSGQNAIAFVPGASSVTLLSALTATAQSASVAFPTAIAEAAVSDNKSVAAALQSSAGTTIRTISSTGTANPAGTVATLGGLTFQNASDDLLLADAAANSLTLIRNSVTAPSPSLIQSANLLKSPQGLGVSRDGRFAVLANSGDANIVRLDLTAQTAPQTFPCNCQPSLVAQLSGTSVFRVTPADSGPAWMLDASATNPRVLFIPASQTTSGQN